MARALRSTGVAVILLLSSILMAGVIAQETDIPHEANVHGIVTDALTGEPVHALIHIMGKELDAVRKIESGRDGTFKLYLPPGAFVWEAEAEGYHPGRGEFKVGEEPIRLPIVLKPLEEDPEEPPEYNLDGVLMDVTTGLGVRGFIAFWNQDGKGTQIETDESGHFKILIPPGPWMWKASARGYKEQDGRLLMERGPLTMVVEMEPLQDEEPEPPEQRFGILYGHVVTPEGKPIPGAMVYLHPMMRDVPPMEPGVPEDPNVRPQETNDPTSSSGDPAGRTRGENEAATSITLREFYAKFSEKFDEETIKRIFNAADMDGDGILNEREILKAHALIRELSGEGEPKDPREPERMPLHAITDENGMFKMRVPFGEYVAEAEARGFHPNRLPVRISPRMVEQKIRIILEPMMDRPDRDMGRMKVVFSMIDQNSDGNPEKVDLMADLNGDGVFEVQYHMIDRTSDGNPESVEWVLDIPMEMWEKIMGLVMMFIKNNQGGWDGMPPMPDDMGNWEEEWSDEGWEDGDLPFDPAILEKIFGEDGAMEDEQDLAETDDVDDGEKDSSLISDKESASSAGTPVFEILAAVGVLLLVLAGVLGIGLFIRRKKN
ncbi:MAG: carboxypeptidase-like regulatory domain-containing protein [Thermoplasmatota archaeon]